MQTADPPPTTPDKVNPPAAPTLDKVNPPPTPRIVNPPPTPRIVNPPPTPTLDKVNPPTTPTPDKANPPAAPEPPARALVLRPPEQVMKTARMGSFHQTRLSFMRTLLRSLKRERWQFQRIRWQVDARGSGLALYRATGPQHSYTLVCFAHDLPDHKRSDRVIAEAWDATFALYDGVPDESEIARLAEHVPKQEAGSCRHSELVLARANRSVRLFGHVVEQLANGLQPHREWLDRSGYLMRTTAVYGNGKFGLSDRERIAGRAEFAPPFRAELLAVWLIRWFTIDIAEHLAHAINPQKAVKLERALARRLGVGNATGLGMAPFLLWHPSLIHRWIHARETALARVRALPHATPQSRGQFGELLVRMKLGLDSWRTEDQRQYARIAEMKNDLAKITHYLKAKPRVLEQSTPWEQLMRWSQDQLSVEGQELLVTLVLEPHGEYIDDLAESMAVDESRYWRIHGDAAVADLARAIETHYAWALQIDYSQTSQCARFWYVSEEKLEPRLGQRFQEPGAEQELPLAFGRDIAALHADLGPIIASDPHQSAAEFLRANPRHRHAVRRIQIVARLPYAEIRDNLISASMRPVDLLRCKLSFFGANQFDPKSDRWVRITMYQHAPLPDELMQREADDWIYPPLNDTHD